MSTTDYCNDHDTISVTSDNVDHLHLTGEYTVVHKSSIGVKYENTTKDVKITFSNKVNNIFSGHWRWAKDSPPYTLYYANPSTEACVPTTGWADINNNVFSGDIRNDNYDIYYQCNLYNVYRKCSLDITPTPTPTATELVLTPTPTPTPTAEPIIISTAEPRAVPPGIIRHQLTELMWVKAKPTITYSNTVKIPIESPRRITVYGLSMNYTDSIYLSGGADVVGRSLSGVDIFSSIPSLSADFPGFEGIPVDFVKKGENIIEVYIPPLVAPGVVDLIILNTAGYDRLNPTYSGVSEWTDYNLQNKPITIE